MKTEREQFNLRVYHDAVAQWRKAAELNGLGLSSWVRWVANTAARQQLAKAASLKSGTKKAASRR